MDIRIKILRLRALSNRSHIALMASKVNLRAHTALTQVVATFHRMIAALYGLRRRIATISVGVFTLWLFAHVMFGDNGMIIYRAKRGEIKTLNQEIISLQAENDIHTRQIDNLKTDPRAIEKEAREQLHYARLGEVVYVTPSQPLPEPPKIHSANK